MISPMEIINTKLLCAQCETHIDATLKAQWKGVSAVDVSIDPGVPDVVVTALMVAYRAVGWTVTHKRGSDQRDGDWSYLVFSADLKL